MLAPNLIQTQQLLWKLITAPEGAAAGFAALHPGERAVAESLVRGDTRLSALERVDVYADMYFYRIRDCLKEDFAAVCAVIGETRFHNLITEYLVAHPSAHFSLRYIGRHVPTFIAQHAFSDQWPYLADLATLEWAILDAFDAPDAAPLDAPALAAVPQDAWPQLRFALTPSLRVLPLQWPVYDLWQQVQRGDAPTEPQLDANTVRVWRQDLRVFHRPIDAVEAAGLAALAEGLPFGEVCEHIVQAVGEPSETGAERAFQLVSEWLTDGLLRHCEDSCER